MINACYGGWQLSHSRLTAEFRHCFFCCFGVAVLRSAKMQEGLINLWTLNWVECRRFWFYGTIVVVGYDGCGVGGRRGRVCECEMKSFKLPLGLLSLFHGTKRSAWN
jgi:hypothetical protein